MKPVILENDHLRVSVLPERGGKIDSLYDRRSGNEWLFLPDPGNEAGEVSGFGTDDAPFTVPDAFGFDEMFPTILPFRWTDSKGNLYAEPDHGRAWRYPWNVLLQNKDELELDLRQEDPGWFFRRRLRLRENRLEFFYRAGNLSGESLPALWTPHPLFSFFPETEIAVPASLRTIRKAMDGGTFGRHGETAELNNIGLPLFQPALLPEGSAYKFYNAEALEESIYSIHDRRGTLTIDCRGGELPWIGFWINNGGWGGQQNIALEPANAPMDSPEQSEAFGVPASLAAGEVREWSMVFKVEE